MSEKYTEEKTIEAVTKALEDPKNLYTQAFINWSGETTDTKKQHSEVIAEYLLENHTKLEIPTLIRKASYKTEGHDGTTPKERDQSNRTEERIALSMFGKTYEHIGKILDYQVPLKNVQTDKGVGKIDLLSHNENRNCLYILELKAPDSKETLLRCLLEAYTYYKTVDTSKLLDNYKDKDNCVSPANTMVKKAVFVFAEGTAHLQYKDGHPKTRELMEKLGVDIFVICGNETIGYKVMLP